VASIQNECDKRSPMVTIRQAKPSDLPDIVAIHIQSWQDAYANVLPAEFLTDSIARVLEKHWEKIEIQPNDILLVAEEGSIVGFAAVWCRPHPFIDNLHVKPSQRSRKIGSALMNAVARELIHKGQQSAYLWLFERNTSAMRFYGRLGGIPKEHAIKNVFGHDVPSRKIEWDGRSLANLASA